MNERDPLDDLLHDAFAADLARTPAPVQVAERVMARIRRRQRVRMLTLAGTLLAGLLVLAVSVEPALAVLAELINDSVPEASHQDGLVLAVLALAGAASLMFLEADWT